MITTNDNKFNQINAEIKEKKEKTVDAKNDKKWVQRDLATYESKFNEKSSL